MTESIVSGSVEQESGNDLLRLCAGGCGNKILFFGFAESENWGENVEGALCIECISAHWKKSSSGVKT